MEARALKKHSGDLFKKGLKKFVINKRAGGAGLILGRKAFQKPVAEGVRIINAVQDVYLDASITLA